MRIILSTVVLFALLHHASAQIQSLDARKHFQYTDTSFEVDEVKILCCVWFYDARFRPESFPHLDSIASFLYYHPELVVEIGSNTDNRGTDQYNLKVTQMRSEAITGYLIEQGISPNRVRAKGYGETMPVAPNLINGKDNPEGQQLNRRTELKITVIVPTKENFIRPTLLNPQLPFIHFLFGENSSAFTLSLFNVRPIERVIDSDKDLDSSFITKYKSCARSYVGFIDATGDSLIMVAINFSSPQRTLRNSLIDSNALSKTQILFINLSKRICLKSF